MADREDTAAQGIGLKRTFVDLGDGSFAEVIDARTLRDDSIKGLLRSIGDAGDTPQNSTGSTALRRLADIDSKGSQLGQARSNYGSSTGESLTVDLDGGEWSNRQQVDVWVKSSAAATFKMKGSRDNSSWRQLQKSDGSDLELVLSAPGEKHVQFACAYRYIRVTTTAANNNEAEIAN